MSENFFYKQITNKLSKIKLKELLPNQITLLSEYNLDINLISQPISSKEDQKKIELCFLGLMYLVTLLDGFYIKKLSEGKDSVAVLEQDFFSCLNALPKLSLEHLQIKEDSFEKQTFSQIESKINNAHESYPQTLDNWFELKEAGLKELFTEALSRPSDGEQISGKILQAVHYWRTTYMATKEEKITTALSSIDKLKEDELENKDEIEPIDAEQLKNLLRQYIFYHPFYSIAHLKELPMNLRLEISLILDETVPPIETEQMTRLEEKCNMYIIEYLKIINAGDRDRNMILHTLNSFSDYLESKTKTELSHSSTGS